MFRDLRLRHLGWPCVGPMILPLTLWLLSGQAESDKKMTLWLSAKFLADTNINL